MKLRIFSSSALIVFALGLFVMSPKPSKAAGPWYVSTSGNDGNACTSPATACASINGALNKPGFVAGDTVYVAVGTYTRTAPEVVSLDKDATLSGGWNAAFTAQIGTSTIDGQGTTTSVSVTSGVIADIECFSIIRGRVLNYGTLGLNLSSVSNGVGYIGAGILNGGTMTVTNSIINNNRQDIESGAGAGVFNQGTMTVNNSTISGNTATYGGGVYNKIGTLTLNNCTISKNSSGIDDERSGAIILQNTIVAGNTGSDCSGTTTKISAGYNLIGNASGCIFVPNTGDLINIDPQIGMLQDNGGATLTHALLAGSPAMNAGNPSGCVGSAGLLTTDQRGKLRADRCDIGAYEVQPLEFSLKAANKSAVTPGDSLSYSIVLTNSSTVNQATVMVTDTLPAQVTYSNGSLSATSGNPSYSSGTVYWNGTINAGGNVAITFGATANPVLSKATNSAIISGRGETFTRTAIVEISGRICNLTKYQSNPVMNVGTSGTWDSAAVWDPTILKEGSTYKMWYTGRDASNNRQIGYATSSDGIVWTKYGSNPVLSPSETWEGTRVSYPSVINDGGTYKIWYAGRDSGGVTRIGYATSPDGITWTKYGSNPVLNVGASGAWDDAYVAYPSVIKVDSTFHIWYEGHDGAVSRIGHATSTDGINWTKDPANPVLNVGSSGSWDWVHAYGPHVMLYNGMYIMWYSGYTVPAASQTGYATSLDGSIWTRKEKLISQGSAGAFDSNSADYVSAIADGTGFKVWYSGLNSAGTYTIGYATADVCGPVTQPPPPSNPIYMPVIGKNMGQAGSGCPAYYTDSFSNADSGWPVGSDSIAQIGYTGGEYQIWFKSPNYWTSVTPGASGTDYIISANARRAFGPGDFGIAFGITEGFSQFYAFLIDPPWYTIRRYSSGSWTAVQAWTTSGYVTGGSNRLKVIRNGTSISVYSNNQLLATVNDGTITGWTRVGLIARAGSSPQDARFDDFAMYPVSCGSGAYAPTAGFKMIKPEIFTKPLSPQENRR